MAAPPSRREYKVRAGTNDSGKEYEFKMITLLALRCISNTKDVWIASNADGVGDFDDILLRVITNNDERFMFMLQLKHKDNPNNLTIKELETSEGKFSLEKYRKDMIQLKSNLTERKPEKGDIIEDLGTFSNIYFVLFTNRGMDINKIKENKIPLLEIDKDDSQVSFVKTLLNTNSDTKTDSVFKFVSSKMDGDDVDNFRLFTNQISSKDLDEEIEAEVKKNVPSKLMKTNFENMAKDIVKYVTDWSKGNLGGNYCLTKDDIIFKLAELYLSQYEVDLKHKKFEYYDSEHKNIWNEIVADKRVTIIDSNQTDLNIMNKCISNEVGKYCKSVDKNWADKLSEKEQSAFYQDHGDLKCLMLKIVGSRGKITLLDIYKCVWKSKDVPLLLKTDDLQGYQNILDILKLSKYSYKVIIMRKDSAQLPQPQDGVNFFATLQDLNQEQIENILSQPAKLQGRALPKLGDLLDETMFENIKCSDIISILSGTFNIGKTCESLPDYFIQRSTTKIFINSQALQYISEEIFVLRSSDDNYLETLRQEASATIISNADSDNSEQVNKYKALGKNIHLTSIYNDDNLEWKQTIGSTERIRGFKNNLENAFESEISYYFPNHTNIISEVPGMGKSILMDYIAHKAPPNKWVHRIDLNKHQRYYRSDSACKNPNTKGLKHLNYFFTGQECDNIDLATKVFQKLLKNKNLIVLLDGFDEISISYKDEVTNIAKSFQKEGYDIWLTTRPHMQKHLEEEFNTFAISLQPFTIDDQKQFLTKYFSGKNNDLCKERLLEFVEGLLEATRENLHDYERKFTGIPLQTKLLADYFSDKCIRDCRRNSGKISFNEKFDLLDLYKNFIDRKLDEFCNKFGESALEKNEKFRKHQPLLALQYVFRLDDFEEINNIKKMDDYYRRKPDKKQNLQRDGIVTIDSELNVNYVHRTYAEFLAAQWLAENLDNEEQNVQEFVHELIKQRFTKNYNFLFNIFDRILAQNCPLHMYIINGQISKAMKIINSEPKCITKKDQGGRTVLHIAALYDDQVLLDNSTESEILKIVKKVSSGDPQFCSKSDALGYTPLDYALANKSSLILANTLCEKSNASNVKTHIDLDSMYTYLVNCEKFGLKALFDILLPYFASRDLLLRETENTNMKNYLKNKRYDTKSNYVDGIKSMSILEFLHLKRWVAYSKSAERYNSDLRYAICFGSEENIDELLSKYKQINKNDVDNNTPLHYAVLHQKINIVEKLLLKGANINKKNSNNQTPLHLAFTTRNFKIINMLLTENPKFDAVDKKGKNVLHYAVKYANCDIVKELIGNIEINRQDNDGNTALNLALQESKMDIAKLLIDNGSDVNIANNNGQNAFHYAIRYDCTDIINASEFKNVNKNIRDVEGNTLIHLELHKDSPEVDVLKFLLDTGANVNIRNIRGETPLHLVLNNTLLFNNNIIELLLSYGAQVNIKNKSGESAVHCAIKNRMTNVVPVLLPKFKDINQQDSFRNTGLHLAANNGDAEIVKILISHRADVNLKNCDDDTALHLAVRNIDTATVKLLISAGACTDIKNKNGKTQVVLASRHKDIIALFPKRVNNNPPKRPPFRKETPKWKKRPN